MRIVITLLVIGALSTTAQAAPPMGLFAVGGTPAGAKATRVENGETITIGPLYGPHAHVGFEIGNHWNNQFSFVFLHAGGPATSSESANVDMAVSITSYALGYQLTYDFMGKDPGFSPYFGAGFYAGQADLSVTGSSTWATASEEGTATTLEFHATAGARYNLTNGFGIRAEVAYSTFGGFLGTWVPMIGVTWRIPVGED